MSSQDDELNKKRRARNDPINRDYKCPCGKSYLSYPALFTHVKQKHGGQAPGPLIKPKNENAKRGRPRGNSVNTLDDEEANNASDSIADRLSAILDNTQVAHNLVFEEATGDRQNCNTIFSRYLRDAAQLGENARAIITGFLWLLKRTLQDKQGEGFCANNNAADIIEVCNDLIDEKRSQYEELFPVPRDLLIKLTKLFFEWLYKHNFTNHRIQQS